MSFKKGTLVKLNSNDLIDENLSNLIVSSPRVSKPVRTRSVSSETKKALKSYIKNKSKKRKSSSSSNKGTIVARRTSSRSIPLRNINSFTGPYTPSVLRNMFPSQQTRSTVSLHRRNKRQEQAVENLEDVFIDRAVPGFLQLSNAIDELLIEFDEDSTDNAYNILQNTVNCSVCFILLLVKACCIALYIFDLIDRNDINRFDQAPETIQDAFSILYIPIKAFFSTLKKMFRITLWLATLPIHAYFFFILILYGFYNTEYGYFTIQIILRLIKFLIGEETYQEIRLFIRVTALEYITNITASISRTLGLDRLMQHTLDYIFNMFKDKIVESASQAAAEVANQAVEAVLDKGKELLTDAATEAALHITGSIVSNSGLITDAIASNSGLITDAIASNSGLITDAIASNSGLITDSLIASTQELALLNVDATRLISDQIITSTSLNTIARFAGSGLPMYGLLGGLIMNRPPLDARLLGIHSNIVENNKVIQDMVEYVSAMPRPEERTVQQLEEMIRQLETKIESGLLDIQLANGNDPLQGANFVNRVQSAINNAVGNVGMNVLMNGQVVQNALSLVGVGRPRIDNSAAGIRRRRRKDSRKHKKARKYKTKKTLVI
jgi:hypothetical protein